MQLSDVALMSQLELLGISSGDSLPALPWPELECPEYKTGQFGDWELTINPVPLLRGYFRGLQFIPRQNFILKKSGETWMSLTPMELESHMPHADAATGHTVIIGAGLGMILYNVLKKPEVEKVTLVEISEEVLTLLSYVTDMKSWPGYEKLTILRKDAFEVTRDDVGDVDFLYVDIWPQLFSDEAKVDMEEIAGAIEPITCGYWGQELEFINYCNQKGYMSPPTGDDFSEWVDSQSIPLLNEDPELSAEMAYRAVTNVVMY